MSIKIKLFEDDFQDLVQGKVVKTTTLRGGKEVEIILADIGIDRMRYALERSIAAFEIEKRNG